MCVWVYKCICVCVCFNVCECVDVSMCRHVYPRSMCLCVYSRAGSVSESAKVNTGTEERVQLRTGLATCLQVHLHLAGSPAHGLRELSRNSNTWSLLSKVHADNLSSTCNICTLHVMEVWCIPVVIVMFAYTPNCC